IPVTERNPAVPTAFAALVHRMMAKDPARRFPSAAAVRQELQAWAEAEPALPLDRIDDTGYREAVAALEAADVPSSELEDDLVIIEKAAPRPPGGDGIASLVLIDSDDEPASPSRDYLWICLGLVGIWVLLLGGLGLLLLLLR